MPRIARHFFWDTLETNNIWQGISISGVNPHYLNSAFGFKPTQTPNYGQRFSVGRDLHEPCQNADRLVLRNEFIMAELHTGCAAHLVVLKPTPRAEADQLRLPLNAALTQQWLLNDQLALHGALIRSAGRGVLILGESRAGKSTMVQAALQLGEHVVTDDFLRITFENSVPIGHCLRGFLRFRASAQGNERVVALGSDTPFFCPMHRVDAVIFLESGERARQSTFAAISRLQAMTLMINQCAPLFLRREFPLERRIMLGLIGQLLELPTLSVATGFDLLEAPLHFMQRLNASLWPN